MKIGIVYGSTTGNTEIVAEKIRDAMGVELAMFADIGKTQPSELQGFDILFVGIPTWNVGELQSDWESAFEALDTLDLSGTKIAMFGLGDQVGYSENFLDAMGIVYKKLIERNAVGGFGFWPIEGYTFDYSLAVFESDPTRFCGLALDNDNQRELHDERIQAWVAQVKQELSL